MKNDNFEVGHDCGEDALTEHEERVAATEGDVSVVVHVVERVCATECCGYREVFVDSKGAHPETVDEIVDLAWGLYREVYDDPRRVSWTALSALVTGDVDAPVEAIDLLARAADMGRSDGEAGLPSLHEEDFRDRVRPHINPMYDMPAPGGDGMRSV